LRLLAIALTVWVATRWLRFVVGLGETFFMPPAPERRRLRQAWIGSGAVTVVLTVVTVLLWASELGRQPGAAFIGFLAAAVICSLAISIIVRFMASAEESAPEGVDDGDDGGSDHHDDQRREDAEE
jgi:hypothetical protein